MFKFVPGNIAERRLSLQSAARLRPGCLDIRGSDQGFFDIIQVVNLTKGQGNVIFYREEAKARGGLGVHPTQWAQAPTRALSSQPDALLSYGERSTSFL